MQKGRFVLGLAEGGAAKAWTYDYIGTRGAVSDTFRREPVLVVYHRPSTTARVYRPHVDGRSLSFRMDGDRLADVETESTWDPVSGRATAGALTGKRLTPSPPSSRTRSFGRGSTLTRTSLGNDALSRMNTLSSVSVYIRGARSR